MALRQFIYYDDTLVSDFLEQLEGGRTDEVTRREQSTHEGHGDLKVGLGGLGAGAGGGRSTSEELEGVTKQTRASRFDRMYDLALDARELEELEDLSVDEWGALRPRRLIAIDVQISIPAVSRLLSMGSGLGALLNLMKVVAPDQVDVDTQDTIDKITMLGGAAEATETLTAVAVPTSADVQLVMRLQHRSLLAQDEIEGEATLVAKVTRKLKAGERELVLDVPVLAMFNREMRHEMLKDADDSVSVEGPGGVVVPVAIFR